MKIISLNLHNWAEPDRIAKLYRFGDVVIENEVDVICLQEVGQFRSDSILYNRIKTSNLALLLKNYLALKGHPYELRATIFKEAFSEFEEGVAILSRLPILDSGETFLSKTTCFTDWMLRKTLYIQVCGYCIATVHLGWDEGQESLEDQFFSLIQYYENQKNVLILGDFNLPSDHPAYSCIRDCPYRDVSFDFFPEYHNIDTFFGKQNSSYNKHIDYALTSLPQIKDYQLLFKTPQTVLSDHAGILLEV